MLNCGKSVAKNRIFDGEDRLKPIKKVQFRNLGYNKQIKRKIENHRFTTHKKPGLEEALEDVANGRLITIHTPKKMN